MPLDKEKYSALISEVLNIFLTAFNNDIVLIEKQIAIEHMGWFRIKYRYLSLKYDIIFESDRDVFSIGIWDDEGGSAFLGAIEKYNCETTPENVKGAVKMLKKILEKNDFYLYITRDGKLYRKKGRQYKRIKDLTEFMEN